MTMIHQRTYQTLLMYLLIVIIVLCYSAGFTAEALTWNDDVIITALRAIQQGNASLWTNADVRPIPLAIFSYFHGFGEGSIFLFHLANVIVHAANTVLLFFLLKRLQQSFTVSIITSALFGLHPLHAGTVAWVSQFSVIFSLTLLLLITNAYLSYCRTQKSPYLWLTGILAVLFHFVIQGGLLVPIILFAVDRVERGKLTKHIVVKKIPFILLSLSSLLLPMGTLFSLYVDSVQFIRFGIVDGLIRIVTFGRQTGIVPLEEVIQKNLIMDYSMYPIIVPWIIVAVVWYSSQFKLLRYCFAGFLLFSLPIVSWTRGGEWLLNSDRYYVSSLFIIFPVSIFLHHRFEKISSRMLLQNASIALGIILFCFSGLQTYRSVQLRGTNISFWSNVLNEYPKNAFILNKIGTYYYTRYEIPQAVICFSRSIQHHPLHYESFNNRGLAYLSIYQMDSAKGDFLRSIEIFPQYALAYYNLSTTYSLESDWQNAISYCTKAIELQHDFVQAYNNRGNSYARQKKYVQAFADYETASRIDPKYPEIYGNRALIYLETGNATNAVKDFQKQSKLAFNRFDVFIHLGLTYIMTADTSNAFLEISNAVKLDSANAKMYLSAVQGTFLKDSRDILLLNQILEKFNPQHK